MSRRGGRCTQFHPFDRSLGVLNSISLSILGRGKVHHKGRRRHFTDAEELRMEMEREQRKQDWRVNGLDFDFTCSKAFKKIQRNVINVV